MTSSTLVSRVAEAMIIDVKVHDGSVTVDELRQFFADDHVHTAVIVDRGVLIAVVDRGDLADSVEGDVVTLGLGQDRSRVVTPGASLDQARQMLLDTGRRRLAVADADGRFRGLLCLKRSRAGFCSTHDVQARSRDRCVLSAG